MLEKGSKTIADNNRRLLGTVQPGVLQSIRRLESNAYIAAHQLGKPERSRIDRSNQI